MAYVQVLINDIDLSSEGHDKYVFNYKQDFNNIKKSLNRIGLISPVVLKKNTDYDVTYTVVCGLRRVMACRALGMESIEAKIIDGINEEEVLLLSLHDNVYSRGFNEIEKAIVLKRFLAIGYSKDRVLAEIAPLLKIPSNKNIMDKYLSVLRLGSSMKQSVARGELELEKAFLLVLFDTEEREIIYKFLFRESITNINEAKETIKNLFDLKLIKQLSIEELLSLEEISLIIVDSKLNKRQKGEKIYRLIKSMRCPTISLKEDEFDKSYRAMRLDNDVRINHSRYFEGDGIRITLKASNEEKLGNNLKKLLSNIRNGMFKKIFSIVE
ncbi:partition protein [Candidatus Scalindua japonica]|uniref:Partition protein n=1 Tax=Candidatus Scalindua japonica TaxID=1284222 RepID=A0A286TTR4_9BACT|nr:ParB/RepB/Spo0J family partition protein [Candidatus Scalindua japonica]GAX59245.1 partition protein [Candidatus Scalindua japonica]